jgi:hypothetical protein
VNIEQAKEDWKEKKLPIANKEFLQYVQRVI